MNEAGKTQAIRLFGDVLFIGPFLIYLALKKKPGPLDKGILVGVGLSTIVYNLHNYLKQREAGG